MSITSKPLQIDRIVLAERDPLLSREPACVSIGVKLSNGRIHWGDCLPVDGLEVGNSTIRRLVDLCQAKLAGQQLTEFRELCRQFQGVFPPSGRLPIADSVKGALEQGLLGAVSWSQEVPVHEVLIQEYGLASSEVNDVEIEVTVRVNDFEATTESVEKLLGYRPHGLGYRLTSDLVAESIGAEGELLIDFVRGLSERARQMGEGANYKPAIYLDLNSAIGKLAGDPVQNIGKVLAICRDLEDAADECQLILESVFSMDDYLLQAANYSRLKKLLLRAPRPQKSNRAQLLVFGNTIPSDDIPVYLETQSVDGIVFSPTLVPSIDETMIKCSRMAGNGVDYILSIDSAPDRYTPSTWVVTIIDIMLARGCSRVVVNLSDDLEARLDVISRHLAKVAASRAN